MSFCMLVTCVGSTVRRPRRDRRPRGGSRREAALPAQRARAAARRAVRLPRRRGSVRVRLLQIFEQLLKRSHKLLHSVREAPFFHGSSRVGGKETVRSALRNH